MVDPTGLERDGNADRMYRQIGHPFVEDRWRMALLTGVPGGDAVRQFDPGWSIQAYHPTGK